MGCGHHQVLPNRIALSCCIYLLDPGKKPTAFQLHFGKGNREVILEVMTGGQPNIDAAQKLGKIA